MTGWDLAEEVAGSTGYFWKFTRSQVYRELHSLEALGYVAPGQTGKREKRPYALTDAGRAAFAEWIARPPEPELIRYPLLLTVFFGEGLDPQHLKRVVAAHRPQ